MVAGSVLGRMTLNLAGFPHESCQVLVDCALRLTCHMPVQNSSVPARCLLPIDDAWLVGH